MNTTETKLIWIEFYCWIRDRLRRFFSQLRITIVIKLKFKQDFILSRHIKPCTEQSLISISLSFQISWSRASGYRRAARSPPRTRTSTSAGTARTSARRKWRDLRLRTSSAPARPRPTRDNTELNTPQLRQLETDSTGQDPKRGGSQMQDYPTNGTLTEDP